MKARKIVIYLVLIIAVLFLGLFGYSRIILHRVSTEYPPLGQTVSLDRGELHYVREGSGYPVVMLHGRDGTLQEYTYSIFDRVAEKHDAIAFDRPGYGYSKWKSQEKLTTELQAHLLNQALQKLDVEKPVLVGHSYGGAVVLQYMLDYPGQVKSAILLSGVAYIDEIEDSWLYNLPNLPLIGPLLTHTLVPLGSNFATGVYEQAFWPSSPPEEYVETMATLYTRPDQFTATAGELSVMQQSVNAMSPRYDEIDHPVTIVFGTADRMLDHETDGIFLAENLPESELILVEGAGHKVHHAHPNIALDAINEMIPNSID